jgi:hypothetical protein
MLKAVHLTHCTVQGVRFSLSFFSH